MANRILIVDDDNIFCNLLTDVFSQAGYEVRSAQTAEEARALLKTENYHLVVTDQQMPGIPGSEFVHALLEERPDLPVIMVSGYLENDTIRDLIRDGVGGVFIKPLNIFQLLKRSAQLIERREKAQDEEEDAGDASADDGAESGGLRSFSGSSPRSAEFVRRLRELRDFSSNLLLVGQKGTDFDGICRDLLDMGSAVDDLLFLSPSTLESESLPKRMEAAGEGKERLTLVCTETEDLNPELSECIFSIAHKTGAFSALEPALRFVFCMRDDLDSLYDSGKINESLYLFMGTTELRVPALKDVPDEIPTLGQAVLDRLEGGMWRLDPAGAAFLREQEWPGDMLQLTKVMQDAAAAAQGRVVGVHDVEDAYTGRTTSRRRQVGNLRQALSEARDDYIRAAAVLCGKDVEKVARVLGVPTDPFLSLMGSSSPKKS